MLFSKFKNWLWNVIKRSLSGGRPAKSVVDKEADALVLPTQPVIPLQSNRHARRSLEAARRKKDKFVIPKGEKPISTSRGPRKPNTNDVVAGLPVAEAFDVIMDVKGEGKYVPGVIADEIDDTDDLVEIAESEIYGLFNFRDSILDQLDRYWVYLRRMKKHDNDAYELYSRVGAILVPPMAMFNVKEAGKEDKPRLDKLIKKQLSPWWKTHRPGFGCVTYGVSSQVEKFEMDKSINRKSMWVPKLIYFLKYQNPPPEFQPMGGGDIYKVTIWWDRPQDKESTGIYKKGGIPNDFGVWISKDGTDVRVLRVLDTRMVPIREKKNGMLSFSIPNRAWTIPEHYARWATHAGLTADELLRGMFIDAASTYEAGNFSMIRVAIRNDDLIATFGVEIKRVPYFFQDRDITLTQSGRKQHIFHIVRPHKRKTERGEKNVRFHFRGLRKFEWAGYHVSITVPERDHVMLSDIDIGGTDSFWLGKSKDWIGEREFGTMIHNWIETGTMRLSRKTRKAIGL